MGIENLQFANSSLTPQATDQNGATLTISRRDPSSGKLAELFRRSFIIDATRAVALGESELAPVGAFSLLEPPTNGFALGTPTIVASFSDASSIDQHTKNEFYTSYPTEAALYAWDQELLGQWLETLPTDLSQLVDPSGEPPGFARPGSVSLVSPSLPAQVKTCPTCPRVDTLTASIDPLWPQYLFDILYQQPFAELTGPGAWPQGRGSIKAATIQRRGWCTNEQFYNDYFTGGGNQGGININDLILTAFGTQTCTQVDELLVHYAYVLPVMRHRVGHPNDIRAQLYLTGKIYLKVGGFGCTCTIAMLMNVHLAPGTNQLVFDVATDGQGNRLFKVVDEGGGGCSGIWLLFLPFTTAGVAQMGDGIHEVLGAAANSLPGTFSRVAMEAQSLPPPALFAALDPQGLNDSGSIARGRDVFYQILDLGEWASCNPNPYPNEDEDRMGTTRSEFVGDRFIARGDICRDARDDICNLVRLGMVSQGFLPTNPIVGLRETWYDDPLALADPGHTNPKLSMFTVYPGCQRFQLPSPDEQMLYALFDAIEQRTGVNERELQHWNCMQSDTSRDGNFNFTNPTSGQCYFTVPIKRLMFRSDGISPVLFDINPLALAASLSAHDNTPAVAAWYALKGLEALSNRPNGALRGIPLEGVGDVSHRICNYARPSGSTLSRITPVPFTIDRYHCPHFTGLCHTDFYGNVTSGDCRKYPDPVTWNNAVFATHCEELSINLYLSSLGYSSLDDQRAILSKSFGGYDPEQLSDDELRAFVFGPTKLCTIGP